MIDEIVGELFQTVIAVIGLFIALSVFLISGIKKENYGTTRKTN